MRCLWVSLFILLTATLTACDRAPETTSHATLSKEAVTFLHYFSGSLSGGLNDMASSFNTNNPRYELKPVSLDHEAFKSSIRDTLQSGSPPDLYSYWAGARTASIVDELQPIDAIWQQAKLDDHFAASLINAASEYSGSKYFLPLTQHYVGFFYNKAVFNAHGLTPPTNWSEFIELCDKLLAANVVPIALGAKEKWPAQFWFDMLLLRSAPYAFRQQLMNGEVGYDDPRVTTVFQIWSELLNKNYFSPAPQNLAWDSGANELVYQGKAAMTLMGTWNIGYFSNEKHQWQAGKDFDFFPFPQIESNLPKVSLGPIDGVIIPKRAPNLRGAENALIYLASVEVQQAISMGSGALAPNIMVPESFYSDIQLRVRHEIDNSQYFAFNYDLATPPDVAQLGLNAFSEFLAFPNEYPAIQQQLAADAKHAFSRISSYP